jgi:hypothetical protein
MGFRGKKEGQKKQKPKKKKRPREREKASNRKTLCKDQNLSNLSQIIN